MMKIGETSGQAPDNIPDPKRRIKDRGGVGSSKGVSASRIEPPQPFAAALFEATQATVSRALDQIMDELGRQGEKLAASQNFDELGKYKELVREFLAKATQGMATLQLTDGGSQGRSGKVHVILKKVDLELEALTRDVLARQATPIAILARLDQIRGLLLDLYK